MIVSSLVTLLTLASFWKTSVNTTFEYQGRIRWLGPWNSPNIAGLLMGAGVVVAFGWAISYFKPKPLKETKTSTWKFKVGKYCVVSVLFCAITLMAYCLVKTFSRGAWLATCLGLTYLLWQQFSRGSNILRWRRNCLPAFIIVLSVVFCFFWHFQRTEWHSARRAFSVGNQNDFSWRNRVAAWNGDCQMMMERPWFGLGWNQTESFYEHYYLPPKRTESGAIQMNDYLLLGVKLGIPALFCFGIYLWLSLTEKSEKQKPKPVIMEVDWLRAICRAGAIVLLVGFWFDGGLFQLPTAAMFWILLELGTED